MSIFQASLLIGAAVAALLAWGNWRAVAWLTALQASVAVSVLYWNAGLPHGELVAGACDIAVCLAIYFFGRWRWEMWIWRLAQTMVLVNVIYLASNLGLVGVFNDIPHDAYSSILEAVNWIAILTIGGKAVLDRLDRRGIFGADLPRGGIRAFVRALRAERRSPPFTSRR